MLNNHQMPAVYPEVIGEMTGYEMQRLMDELTALMQNHNARVEVSQERGFPYLWRVLSGKQSRLRTQINVDQAQINALMQTLLEVLTKQHVGMQQDMLSLEERMHYQERITALQSMYIIRMNQEIERLGGQAADTAPLEAHLADQVQEPECLPKPVITCTSYRSRDPFFAEGETFENLEDSFEFSEEPYEAPEPCEDKSGNILKNVLGAVFGVGLLGAVAAGLFIAEEVDPFDLHRWDD